ncbi:MAG: DUF4242 domain-containing protein [Maribacter sp.]|nr:DUF4242 domain-containing protein [Maribacter sp.]
MPLYLDRHTLSEEITAEKVAQLHKEDLRVEQKFGCRGLTYWFDDQGKTAFCLVEAPDKEAIKEMHNHAHGEIPQHIIQVNEELVASFLGRLKDPDEVENKSLKLIDDPSLRVILVMETSNYLNRLDANQFSIFTGKFHKSVTKAFKHFEGSIVKKDNNSYLVSFKTATNAVLCALKIQSSYKYITPKFDARNRRLNIGICAGKPVTAQDGIFAEAIAKATQMCEVVRGQVKIASSVKTLYDKENRHARIDRELIRTLKPQEEKFMMQLMGYCEKSWRTPNFNVGTFSAALGLSKSQLYRKLKQLTGKSPNTFIREYRLHEALKLLHDQFGKISDIAFKTGFNSPAYFTKCFTEKFGILPSKYAQLHFA